jgi:hypothetical protein
MDNPTIIVTWEPKKYKYWGAFAVLDAQIGMPIRIKGAGFKPKTKVKLTICEKDTTIGTAEINACGAFEFHGSLPAVPTGPASVKAWYDNNCLAYYPLDVYKELPYPPKI